MSKRLLIFVGVGLVVVAIALTLVVSGNKGAHLELKGQIVKIRTGALGEGNSIAVMDFRVENPSDKPFVVGDVEASLDPASGDKVDGVIVSKSDLKQIFQYNRFLGDQYNEGLGLRDVIAPHTTVDRMVAAHFEIAAKDLDQAKAIHLSVHDPGGAVWETTHSVH